MRWSSSYATVSEVWPGLRLRSTRTQRDRSIDKCLEQEQKGLEKANGKQAGSFDDDQATTGTEDARYFGDDAGVVNVFRGKGAYHGIK